MCYSALVIQSQKKLARQLGAEFDEAAYEGLFFDRLNKPGIKIPKAMDDAVLAEGGRLGELVRDWRGRQAADLERLRAEQRERLEKALAKLAVKETKAALNDRRIATNKIAQYGKKLDDLERSEPEAEDYRIWPGEYSAVVVADGRRLIRPMRYQCRLPGWTAEIEKQFEGTYNARRDKLGSSWKRLFRKNHGLIVAEKFYERVDRDGRKVEMEFEPSTRELMLVPCLWSYDPQDRLYSFGAITDDPEPEVAATGHDRTPINIKPEYVDAWLSPESRSDSELQAIFDDKRHPYYEHREAA